METILLNPNIAYLALVAGFLLAILAILTPGTGVYEISALFALLLAGWAMYNLPLNLWALIVLAASLAPFILAMQRKGRFLFLALSIVMMVIGSAFLFRGDTWWQPAVHPFLALLVSLLMVGFIWLASNKVMQARLLQPAHNLESLMGMLGEAKTDIFAEGSVQVSGELWSAQSQTLIPAGSNIRVIGREGLTLTVESTNQHQS